MFKIKKNDKVVVLSGKDKGKKGKVIAVFPEKSKAIVSKINLVKKHIKPTKMDSGGIQEKESPINMSKVMLICPKCNQASRPKFDRLLDGKKVRVCRKCGEMLL